MLFFSEMWEHVAHLKHLNAMQQRPPNIFETGSESSCLISAIYAPLNFLSIVKTEPEIGNTSKVPGCFELAVSAYFLYFLLFGEGYHAGI